MHAGLYEALLTFALQQNLDQLSDPRLYSLAPVDCEDAHSALAQFLEHATARSLASFRGAETADRQKRLFDRIIAALTEELGTDWTDNLSISTPLRRLLAIHTNPRETPQDRPDTPLARSALLTGTRLDPSLGSQLRKEIAVGGREPENSSHLFCSIQSYNSRELWRKPPDEFAYIVVDEFHHAAAPSYRRLLDHVRPQILLGLTATPERSDQLDVLHWFDGRTSAEIRLPDAINRRLLCPFQYFGVADSVDLDSLVWQRGGYRVEDLDRVYTGNDVPTTPSLGFSHCRAHAQGDIAHARDTASDQRHPGDGMHQVEGVPVDRHILGVARSRHRRLDE